MNIDSCCTDVCLAIDRSIRLIKRRPGGIKRSPYFPITPLCVPDLCVVPLYSCLCMHTLTIILATRGLPWPAFSASHPCARCSSAPCASPCRWRSAAASAPLAVAAPPTPFAAALAASCCAQCHASPRAVCGWRWSQVIDATVPACWPVWSYRPWRRAGVDGNRK